MDYKSVSIYIRSNDDLFILSKGVSKKWGGAIIEIEVHRFLESGFTDEMLEFSVYRALEDWNVIEPNEELMPSAIEKILKVKGYLKSVKQMKSINVEWYSDEGYKIVPTKNSGKNGFVYLEENTISIGKIIRAGNLALAIKSAISLSK
ncbi:hypothetical protein SAMN05444162_3243 [Paenibacillaceae bacterium GAS479]|nr:hypothetical protein SAMN05444162_3243 [Paenibacillaceae bacterium GAS479]